jgi:hypothetical protein
VQRFTLCVDERTLVAWPALASDADAARLAADTTWYVVLGIENETSDGDASIHDILRAAAKNALLTVPGYAIAPPGESIDAARKRLGDGSAIHLIEVQVRVAP